MAKIRKIELLEVETPLKVPFVTALRRVESIKSILVSVEDENGIRGMGETVATAKITGDVYSGIKEAIKDYIAPAITGMDTNSPEDILRCIHASLHGNTSPKAACDMAVYDLLARQAELPLYKYLGGGKKRLTTDITISLNSVQSMVEDARRASEEGYHIFKIKLGGGDGMDPHRVISIAGAVPGARLRLDANQAWTPMDAVRIMERIEGNGVSPELLEQPVHYSDIQGMRYVRDRINTPLLADESVFSLPDAKRIIESGSADYINIKLMKTGGIYKAREIASLAEKNGVKCMMGCMLESRLAVSAAAHFAATCPNIAFADLDGPGLCSADMYVGGSEFSGEVITLNEDPGLGIEVKKA